MERCIEEVRTKEFHEEGTSRRHAECSHSRVDRFLGTRTRRTCHERRGARVVQGPEEITRGEMANVWKGNKGERREWETAET